MKEVTIIDYGSGNLRSISNALTKLKIPNKITNKSEEITNAQSIILPGVGAFGTAMDNIKPYQKILKEHIQDDKPFLGICLGLHLLLGESEENPGVEGFQLIPGKVEKIPEGPKIPHMGWNTLKLTKNCPILEGTDKKYFYFVHSYHAKIDNPETISALTEYETPLVAAISQNNLFATQFHPEKSGVPGLKILKNFIQL